MREHSDFFVVGATEEGTGEHWGQKKCTEPWDWKGSHHKIKSKQVK